MFFSTEKIIPNEQQRISLVRLFHRIFVDDWLIKLFAVIITLSLWFGVTGLRAPITTRLNGVSLVPRVSNEMEITNSPVDEVDLVITGDKNKIAQINKNDLVVSLDLTDVQAGERTIQLTPEDVVVELPTGIQLTEIQPNKIAVKLEKVEEREVAVRANTEGSIADGFEIYSQTVTPPRVRVRGPASYVRSLDFISTEPINLGNHRQNFVAQQVPLSVANSNVKVLDAAVDVAFSIGEKRIERLFVVPYQTDSRSGRAQILLFGARSVLENLQPESLQIVEERTDDGRTSLRVNLPAELQEQVQIRNARFRE